MTAAINDIIIIAAVSENDTIGKDGKIPWHIGEDLKRFKKLTMGHTVLMGRKTYESLPDNVRPLKGRKNIVLSSSADYDPQAPDVVVCNDLNSALIHARYDEKVFIIGGAEVYKEAIEYADYLELTVVHGDYEGDAFFPYVDFNGSWKLEKEEKFDDYSFLTYSKRL